MYILMSVGEPDIARDAGRPVPNYRTELQNAPEGLSALQKIADMTQVYKITGPDFGKIDQAGVRKQFMAGQLAMTPRF